VPLFKDAIKSICRAGWLAAVLFAALGPLAGCAMWNAERWSLNRYRDERAVDIDRRLSDDRPIVANPF
jgi:hypothetical protein